MARASKPIYAKKIKNAPAKIPAAPLGANGVQFSGFTKNAPATTNKEITAYFITTINPAIFAESLVPLTNIQVINKTIKIAGKLIQIGTPNKVGI